jgi:NADH-quinone oxidoreductase subunit L
MLRLLWLIPMLPVAGFIILILAGPRLRRRTVSIIAVGSIAASTVITALVAISFLASPPAGNHYSQTLWTWMAAGNFTSKLSFYLDALSLVMVCVVTLVSLLIHLYSTAFMADDEAYSRFFAYMNLFVGSMLVLLLGEDLLVTYLGWEGVGLCSYLLIGFWYKDRTNASAAVKAFVVTRIGDAAMAVGLFILVAHFGTLQIPSLMASVSRYPVGSPLCTVVALLLLGGAVGKSAQLPLQTWLPDAMAGPTPVSALIHAATMVTAGVYLIARTHAVFIQAPAVMMIVAAIGAATLLLAAFSACVQQDIKRILAYSTMSQIGYMFLGLGVGAWYAAIYHFITHAFFKSALFLGAGVLIKVLHEEHNIFKMGGMRTFLPGTHRAFLAAALVLAALPPLTLTFNSKDVILNQALLLPGGGGLLWALGLIGAFLTAFYTFRLFFVVFLGPAQNEPGKSAAPVMLYPLVVLAFLASIAGLPELIKATTGTGGFYDFLNTAVPRVSEGLGRAGAWGLQIIYAATSVVATGLAYQLYVRRRGVVDSILRIPGLAVFRRILELGWGFDWLYAQLLVKPYTWIARTNRDDFVDGVSQGLAWACRIYNRALSLSVNGNVRWYVAVISIGSVVVLALVIFL